jgi:hypothetical protein
MKCQGAPDELAVIPAPDQAGGKLRVGIQNRMDSRLRGKDKLFLLFRVLRKRCMEFC